ncbi:hypothetical protein N7462_001061 [Penicillium macrosclerotiorum]|uniref:uncharacterized protein n=1 Tax=Penicillium macrosclerotiorum TaxID=303699 RepID=UPI0025481A8C|nr:uncharacterized protein N7462_001061 [Penicillium macrosclerotiorum]KAJ5699056.1 hypothetical protein N7462_001061 [Penicillium macrosclerotiorum]
MKLIASSPNLIFRYNHKQVIPPVASRYLGSPVHPIHPKIAYMYEHRDKNTLWWRVSVAQLIQYKRVVRSWCARRVRIAVKQALQRHGYDQLGSPLSTSPLAGQATLTGSLEVIIRQKVVTQNFETVQNDANDLLTDILAQRAKKLRPSRRL